MKITVEVTNDVSRSPLGAGRVWVGETEMGTPVQALICGMLPGSDDPAMVARFQAEHDAIPELVCPDCGGDLASHGLIAEVAVDLHEIVAVWIMAYGESRVPIPEGATPEKLAESLRNTVRTVDPDYHDALVGAAAAVTKHIVHKLMEANGIKPAAGMIGGGGVMGHA